MNAKKFPFWITRPLCHYLGYREKQRFVALYILHKTGRLAYNDGMIAGLARDDWLFGGVMTSSNVILWLARENVEFGFHGPPTHWFIVDRKVNVEFVLNVEESIQCIKQQKIELDVDPDYIMLPGDDLPIPDEFYQKAKS